VCERAIDCGEGPRTLFVRCAGPANPAADQRDPRAGRVRYLAGDGREVWIDAAYADMMGPTLYQREANLACLDAPTVAECTRAVMPMRH
jgi:hypothetical protein